MPGILKGTSDPTHAELLEKVGATRPLYYGTRFGPTTSSNSTNKTNYGEKHAENNESQSRQSILNAYNLPKGSYRPIGKYVAPVPLLSSAARNPKRFENAVYARNLQLARIPSKEESYITPTAIKSPRGFNATLAKIYAQISAESSRLAKLEESSGNSNHIIELDIMTNIINKYPSLTNEEKQLLIQKGKYEYNSPNIQQKWNSLPPGINRRKTRKTCKTRKN